LLVLMKLRMAVITELLLGKCGISSAHVSQIIITWVKMLAATLRAIIFWPSKKVIRQNLPKALEDCQHLCTTGGIENCIERPHNLKLKAIIWTNDRKHNTIHVIVGITPNGAISCQRHGVVGPLTRRLPGNSFFLYLVESNDLIKANKGFTIQEEYLP